MNDYRSGPHPEAIPPGVESQQQRKQAIAGAGPRAPSLLTGAERAHGFRGNCCNGRSSATTAVGVWPWPSARQAGPSWKKLFRAFFARPRAADRFRGPMDGQGRSIWCFCALLLAPEGRRRRSILKALARDRAAVARSRTSAKKLARLARDAQAIYSVLALAAPRERAA